MVTEEIKQFVISQMREADWEIEKYATSSKLLLNILQSITELI